MAVNLSVSNLLSVHKSKWNSDQNEWERDISEVMILAIIAVSRMIVEIHDKGLHIVDVDSVIDSIRRSR